MAPDANGGQPALRDGEAAPLLCEQAVTSTNDVAIDAAREGAVHGWAVCAERQTAGRGRRGHVWASPAGSLYLSIVLRPNVPMQHLIAVPAVSAMGVMDALHALGLAGHVGIKWPNDIVARVDDGGDAGSFDRKLAGILVEARSSADGPFAVVGIGVNVEPVEVPCPQEGEDEPAPNGPKPLPPVSLAELLGDEGSFDLQRLAAALRDAVVARADAWAAAMHGPEGAAGPLAPILSEYFDMVPMLGHQVVALSPSGRVMDTGVFSGLDVWGRAVLMTAAGERTYPSEAVSLRAL